MQEGIRHDYSKYPTACQQEWKTFTNQNDQKKNMDAFGSKQT